MNKRQTQLMNNLYDIFGGYANGMNDCPDEYKALTLDECIDMAKPQIYDIKATGHGLTRYGKGICKDLKFLGNIYINAQIEKVAKECEVLTDET